MNLLYNLLLNFTPHFAPSLRMFYTIPGSQAVFGPDHLTGLRPGIRYPAWASAAGAFGASPAQAPGRGGADGGGGADDPAPPFLRYF